MVRDFSQYKRNDRFYSGAERKTGIDINGAPYIVKFQKRTLTGYTYSHVSEYLGSHIFALLGIPTQETMLGTYAGHNVVVMRDFIGENEQFVPFNDVGDSSLERDREQYRYTYDEIMDMLRENRKLTHVEETVERFWDMYIVDALIGNFDRHGGNWGFLKRDNQYRIAPVFDNGSSLYPQLCEDKEIERVLSSEEEMNRRVFQFPTSQIKHGRKKSSYHEIIHSLAYEECNRALLRIVPRIQLDTVNRLINEVEGISETRRRFYQIMLKARYEKILLPACQILMKRGGADDGKEV